MNDETKILITAAVGAVFGVLLTILSVIIKKWMGELWDRRQVENEVVPEFKDSLNTMEILRNLLERAERAKQQQGIVFDQADAFSEALDLLSRVADDRYRDSIENRKGAIYWKDPNRSLAKFYSSIALAADAARKNDVYSLVAHTKLAMIDGKRFVADHKILYTYTPSEFFDGWFMERRT